jgi:hypothetical protein
MSDESGAERMFESVTLLAVAGKVLAGLVGRLASATADEIPALTAAAKTALERLVKCCADTASVEHLPPEIADKVRAELIGLRDALQAHVAGVLELRLAQLTEVGSSGTRH